MSQEFVIHLARETLTTTLLLAAPALLFGMLVGLIISVLQATTQIQEQTLTFVPKIVVVMLTILVFGSWMLNILVVFTQNIFNDLSTLVR
ncbi:flagellar biosynthesis protein FliQ [Metallumcola ferriviriculae]|uniref:Flagellar biosynthetic protein FliQ n=1 Tax=Metallumcola ferriviriculae TaxID=3039180 RepID=A0AAU0UQL4_9FIRM|nr:flagellar biosynthesis protein FliQ [Desulfitibacteraceae bacterium MK1]